MSFDLCQLLMKIRGRPGLYLGKSSLTALNHFTNGYSFKEYEIHGAAHSQIINLRHFQEYTEGFYSLHTTTKNVFTIIAENTNSDEEAFHRFFELLDAFCEQNDIQKLHPIPHHNPHTD